MKSLRHYHRKWRIRRNLIKRISKNLPLLIFLGMSHLAHSQNIFEGFQFMKNDEIFHQNYSFLGTETGRQVEYRVVDFDGDGDEDFIGRGYRYKYTYCYSTIPDNHEKEIVLFYIENIGTPKLPYFKIEPTVIGKDISIISDKFRNTNIDKIKELKTYKVLCSQSLEENQYNDSIMELNSFDFGDFDKDGDLDLVTLQYYYVDDYNDPNYGINFYKNIGTKTNPIYDTTHVINEKFRKFSMYSMEFQVADIDADGLDDIAFIYQYYDQIEIDYKKNQSNETVFNFENENQVTLDLPSGIFFNFPLLHILKDVDNNGFVDIFTYKTTIHPDNYPVLDLKLFLNENNILTESESSEIINISNDVVDKLGYFACEKLHLTDIDNDGDSDFIFLGDYVYYNPLPYASLLSVFYYENKEKPSIASGKIEFDLDNDGFFTSEEQEFMLLSNYNVKITTNNYSNYSKENKFSVVLPEPSNLIQPYLQSFNFSPQNYQVNITSDSSILVKGLNFNASYDSTKFDYTALLNGAAARPGFQTLHTIIAKSTNFSKGATIAYQPDSNLTIESVQPMYDSFDGSTYFWDLDTLYFNKPYYININLLVNLVPRGTELSSNVRIQGHVASEQNLINNYDTLTQIVTGSYDPNDKLVTPTPLQDDITLVSDKPFTYTIRFQNTGNDTAFNIMVIDTIDNDFDLSTFEILATSHPCETSFGELRDVKFFFEDILLPDSSTNEPASHGFIKYSIQPKQGAGIGTTFTNKADIYFDFNTPITTNETRNIFGVISGINQHQHQQNIASIAYPNPTREKLLIEFNNPEKQATIITIYDINGKQLLQKTIEDNFFSFNTEAFSNGIYLYTIESIVGFGKGKFVKE
ncbi:MAG: T9SS type A sorting domain-containing protein [Chitinophagales bacterium]|nr:T9SS type A sorting domain-containing protein [Chitinophagales bacterium]